MKLGGSCAYALRISRLLASDDRAVCPAHACPVGADRSWLTAMRKAAKRPNLRTRRRGPTMDIVFPFRRLRDQPSGLTRARHSPSPAASRQPKRKRLDWENGYETGKPSSTQLRVR